jgi:hypothetical protein
MGMDFNVLVFHKAIQANGKKNDVDIVNMFCFTFHDATCEWGEKIMKAHLVYRFDELEVMFYKCYQKIQMHEQVYMALRMIKQGGDEKVEIYYKCLLKLANCL